jgi:septal ring factor EnvC (AmiA/AmiB activator)
MWKLTKQYFEDVWDLLWSKTSIDEKAIATIKEMKRRYNLTTKELSDVADAIKKVGKEISDIDNAIKGK